MAFATLCVITALSIVVLFLSFVLIYRNGRGKIEIKITKTRKKETSLIYGVFFFEIIYLSKTKKEQTAVVISQLLREEFDHFYNNETDLAIIELNLLQIIASVTANAKAEAKCEIVSTKTRISVAQFHDWPKSVFSEN